MHTLRRDHAHQGDAHLSDAVLRKGLTWVGGYPDQRSNRYYLRPGDRLHTLNHIPPKGMHHLKSTNERRLARGPSTSVGVLHGQRPETALIGRPYFLVWRLAAWSGSLRLHFISTAGFPFPLLALPLLLPDSRLPPIRVPDCTTVNSNVLLISNLTIVFPVL